MVKKLIPVMAVPAISGGMVSLIWTYNRAPLDLKNPKQKNSIIRITKVVFEESMVSISRMRMKITIPPDMTHLRV